MQAGWGLSPQGASHLHPDFSPRPVSTVGGGARAESGGSEAEDAGVQSHEAAGTEGQFPGGGAAEKTPSAAGAPGATPSGAEGAQPLRGDHTGEGPSEGDQAPHCLEWTPAELRSRLHHCQENTTRSGEKLAKPLR